MSKMGTSFKIITAFTNLDDEEKNEMRKVKIN
jgi:hypothetical protein